MSESFPKSLLLSPHGFGHPLDLAAHLIVAAGVIVMGFIFMVREHASRSSVGFFGIVVALMLWVVGQAGAHGAADAGAALWWEREVVTLGFSFLPSLLLVFVFETAPEFERLRRHGWWLAALSLLFYLGFSRTELLLPAVQRHAWGYDGTYSLLALPFALFVVGAYLASALLLWTSGQHSASVRQRRRSRLLVAALAVSAAAFVEFLTGLGVDVYPFGYLAIFAGVAFGAPIVGRYHFSEITAERMSDEIVDSMSEGLVICDLRGVVRVANAAAARMLGSSVRELAGRPLARVEALASAGERLSEILGRGTDSFQTTLPGSPECVLGVSISVVRDRAGEPSSLLCLLRDVTASLDAERTLRRERNLLRSLVDLLPEQIYFKDTAGRKQLANPTDVRWMAQFGVEHTWMGKTDGEIFPSEIAARYDEEDRSVLVEGREIVDQEDYFVEAPTGRAVWMLSSKLPVRDERGTIVGLLGIGRDVTDAKLAEQRLRRLNRELRAISNCNQIIVRATDELRMIRDVCRVACVEAGYLMAWVGYAEHDAAKTVRPVAWAGKDEGFLASAAIRWGDEELGRGISGTAIRTGRITYTQDIAADPFMAPWREQALARGYRSSIALPLKDERGATFGVLCITSGEPNAFTEDELRMLEELGADLAFGISSLRARGERTQAKEALAESELRFRQVQKMEALGRLAGGVAHDFNNLLTVILSCSEMLAVRLARDDQSRSLAAQIGDAGRRAASLTRQLLAFSRGQHLEPQVVDLNATVEGLREMLARLIGEDVELEILRGTDHARALVDPPQLEQAIINLAINARDAMPDGGRLVVETAEAVVDSDFARSQPEARPGDYVLVQVSDTGQGMDESTMSHLFEPFFTTKEAGRGTGLGLAMVYGFVKQSRGFISAKSELGRGTTFSLYLPRALPAERHRAADSPSAGGHEGTETLLLAEDEAVLRSLLSLVLRSKGYRVIEAANGEEAMELAGRYPERIDLLVTDVVMPRMNGRRLAELLAQARPAIRVLFLSGYLDDGVMGTDGLRPGAAFLHKPITPAVLARKVREVLDGPAP